jgi:hypothetical protein
VVKKFILTLSTPSSTGQTPLSRPLADRYRTGHAAIGNEFEFETRRNGKPPSVRAALSSYEKTWTAERLQWGGRVYEAKMLANLAHCSPTPAALIRGLCISHSSKRIQDTRAPLAVRP